MKGLLVEIFKSDLGDCTNGGVTGGDVTRAIVYGVGLPEIFSSGPGKPALEIIPNPNGAGFGLVAVPSWFPEGVVGPMFGGNFVWTSDSRFRGVSSAPIPVHDRFETPEQYEALSR